MMKASLRIAIAKEEENRNSRVCSADIYVRWQVLSPHYNKHTSIMNNSKLVIGIFK